MQLIQLPLWQIKVFFDSNANYDWMEGEPETNDAIQHQKDGQIQISLV